MTTTDQLAAIEASIPDDAVEAAAQTLWIIEHGPWISGGGIATGGTPWGTSREATHRSRYRVRARAALEAAHPALLAMVREQRAALALIANQANASEMMCRMNGMDPELASVPAGAIRAAITATEGA